jgi:hypothetical protein
MADLNIAKYPLAFKPSLSIMKEDTLPILPITLPFGFSPSVTFLPSF